MFATTFMLTYFLADHSFPKTNVVGPYETSVDFQQAKDILSHENGISTAVRLLASYTVLNIRVSRIPEQFFAKWSILCVFTYGAEVEPGLLLLQSFIRQLYQPWMTEGEDLGGFSLMNEWLKIPK
jgi:hypothetical protein